MLPDLQERMVLERHRRDAALLRMERTITSSAGRVADGVSNAVGELTEGGMVRGVIRASPLAACFASLGAGVLASRVLSQPIGSSEPQRVVVEVQTANGTVVPAAAPLPAPFNPLEMIMQGLTVYSAVRRSMAEVMNDVGPPEESPEAQNQPTENPI